MNFSPKWIAVFMSLVGVNSLIGVAMAIEEPVYQVKVSEDGLELRAYEARIVAETEVKADFSSAGNESFRRLAGYIFGANQGSKKIAMTAPVGQEESSGAGERDKSYRNTFTLPRSWSFKDLPSPQDGRVKLREVPPQLVAVLKYSGTWSQERYLDRKAQLQAWIQKKGWKETGQALFARYNPPWTPWFLRRNEIWIPVETSPGLKEK